jgi:hypothetical protein
MSRRRRDNPSRFGLAERLRAEIEQDLVAANSYMAEHGSFAEMVREHYGDSDEAGVAPMIASSASNRARD